MDTKTTFIVGAGASVDYGFPTGYDLIKKISSVCKSLDNFYSNTSGTNHRHNIRLGNYIVSGLKIHKNDAQSAVRKIAQTIWLSKSIDNYLNEQNDSNIKEIGKLLIFYVILNAEEHSPLKWETKSLDFGRIRETWLMHFFRELRGSETDLEHVARKMQNLKIINFNYDRTIECFLIKAFSLYDNLELQKAKELIEQNLEITHVYGGLGVITVDGKVADLNGQLPFGLSSEKFPNAMQNYENIKLFTEHKELNSLEIVKAREWIEKSNSLVFLGFGFHSQNLKILKTREQLAPLVRPSGRYQRKIYATGMGLSNIRIKDIWEEFNRIAGVYISPTPDLNFKKYDPVIEDCTCPELFEKYGEQFF